MHRCWLPDAEPLAPGAVVRLSPEESAHVARVLRMKAGEHVRLIAAESLYEGELLEADAQAATVRVLCALPSPECPVRVTLAQGLPKQDKLETIVQKVTELGAWAVLPMEMERSVARLDDKEEKKRERLARIALEAAKQSGRAHVPEVQATRRFAQAVETLAAGGYDAVFVAWEEENALRLSDAVATLLRDRPAPQAVAVVVGPEGGIAPGEIERLRAVGAVCVSLGKRILRTETAGLCALSVIMAGLGEL